MANSKTSSSADVNRSVTVSNTTRQRISLARFRGLAQDILQELGVELAAINIVFVGERRMATLALRKGKKGATNVLAFAYRESSKEVMGDVFLCPSVVAREAKQYDRTAQEHLVALLIHGIVHLTGETHETDVAYKRMQGLEDRLIKQLT